MGLYLGEGGLYSDVNWVTYLQRVYSGKGVGAYIRGGVLTGFYGIVTKDI